MNCTLDESPRNINSIEILKLKNIIFAGFLIKLRRGYRGALLACLVLLVLLLAVPIIPTKGALSSLTIFGIYFGAVTAIFIVAFFSVFIPLCDKLKNLESFSDNLGSAETKEQIFIISLLWDK